MEKDQRIVQVVDRAFGEIVSEVRTKRCFGNLDLDDTEKPDFDHLKERVIEFMQMVVLDRRISNLDKFVRTRVAVKPDQMHTTNIPIGLNDLDKDCVSVLVYMNGFWIEEIHDTDTFRNEYQLVIGNSIYTSKSLEELEMILWDFAKYEIPMPMTPTEMLIEMCHRIAGHEHPDDVSLHERRELESILKAIKEQDND